MAAYAIQFRRGTTTEHSSFTGLAGEVTVDTTKNTVVVHDGSTQGGHALALEGAALSSTTGSFSSNVTVGGTLAVTSTTTMGGNLTMTGHILPSANVTYDLGSTSKMWRDVYIGPGSLYINGKKVIEDDSGSINVTTDANEDLKFTTSGTGTLKLISGNGISITGEINATSGDIQIGDHIDMNSSLIKELATPVSSTDAANKAYVDSTSASAVTGGSNAGSFTTLTLLSVVT
jgi:RNase P/RNase MRP subunit p29